MKRLILLAVLAGALGPAQDPRQRPEVPPAPGKSDDIRLPNGKSQREEMLKADYTRNLADATELSRLAAEVKGDIEKNDRYAVSVKTLKKLDEITKLTRNIHGRLNRY
ncbi:MAG TPA: hypothetical protein VN841_22250 [Bryobacteraceae bacterium]|nr:hypothetical protein [Bryobacteraceae bacterium]